MRSLYCLIKLVTFSAHSLSSLRNDFDLVNKFIIDSKSFISPSRLSSTNGFSRMLNNETSYCFLILHMLHLASYKLQISSIDSGIGLEQSSISLNLS